ncbi:MAG: CIA30 family protein [Elusimicrobiota bacterium]
MIKKILSLTIAALFAASVSGFAEESSFGVRVIEDFEANNPYGIFQVRALDSSSIDLYVSHKAKVDAGALQINYSLKTSRSVPSQVEIKKEPSDTNWDNFLEVRMWVKGDASGNIFKMYIVDDDEEIYEYEDHNILLTDTWNEFAVPLESFILTTAGNIGNRAIDVSNIRIIGFVIKGRTPEAVSGIILLDDLVGAGPDLPQRAKPKTGLPKGRVKIGTNLTAKSKFRSTPEASDEWFNEFNIKFSGQAQNYSAYVELSPTFQEYGQGVTVYEDSAGNSSQNLQGVGIPNFTITATDLPHLTSLQIGNLWIDYGPYVYTPVWGYQGVQAEGKMGSAARTFDYHGFIIKHRYNSFTYGTRFNLKWMGFEQRGMLVHSNQMAKKATGLTDASTVTTGPENLTTAKISDDSVFYYEIMRKFGNLFVLKGVYGADTYRSDAYADMTDPLNPVYTGARPNSAKITETDFLKIGRAEIYPPGTGTSIHYEYRDIGEKYIPRWRADRTNYDNDWGNQKGNSFYFAQDIPLGFVLSGLMVDIKRKADDQYYKHSKRFGVSNKPYRGLETSFSREYLDDKNYHAETRYNFSTYRNYEVYINELYLSYQFSQTSRMNSKYSVWKGWDRGLDKKIANHSISIKAENNLTSNAFLSAEYIYTQYTNASDAPKGEPYDDDRIQIEIRLDF